ncbi:MAG: tetratricopeptide repeat protein [Planctomycetota bacterium]
MITIRLHTALVFLVASLTFLVVTEDLSAQNRDVIVRKDSGKKQAVDKVISETYKEITYKSQSAERTLATDKVKEIIYYDIPDPYRAAQTYLNKGEYENAISSFKLAMEKRTTRSWVKTYSLFQIAKAYQQWGAKDSKKYNDAISNYEELLKQDPETRFYPEVLFNIGDCYSSLKDNAKAIQAFQTLGQEAYDKKLGVLWEAKAKYEKANTQLNSGAFDDAERDFRSAMTFAADQAKAAEKVNDNPVLVTELDHLSTMASLRQGTVMIRKNKIKDARRFFDDILSSSSSSRAAKAGACCGLAECLMTEGDLKEAQIEFAKSKVLYFDIPEESAKATYFLGELCLLLKDREPNYKKRAKDYFQEVLDYYPDTSWVNKARAKLD